MNDSESEEEELCHLLEGFVDYLAQVVLLVVAFGGLWYKRQVENPRRPTKIWGLDVAKQAFSGLAGHLCNMIIATIVAMDLKSTSPCSWYFVVYMIDTVLGVAIAYVMHRSTIGFLKERVNKRYSVLSGDDGESHVKTWAEHIIACGEYGNPPSLRAWAIQMSEWVVVSLASRFVCGCAIFLLRGFLLVDLASSIDRLYTGHPHLLLFSVMVACPVLMNLIQAWIQDNILKWKQQIVDSNKEVGNVQLSEHADSD